MNLRNEIITSRNNPIVKWACSLQDKKGRDGERAFIVEGRKLSLEAIEAQLPIKCVFVAESKSGEYLPRLREMLAAELYSNTELIILSDSAFDKISSEKAPQGIISVIKYLDFFKDLDIIYKEDFFHDFSGRVTILSSVRDPGNLGSIIRSSVALGTEHIVLSRDCADVYNTKVVRAAMGSLFKIKITYVNDLPAFINLAKEAGRRVFSAELSETALSLDEIEIRRSDIFVIGNEGHGVAPEVSSSATNAVYIPISSNTESLNAAVAAALLMWEQSKSEI